MSPNISVSLWHHLGTTAISFWVKAPKNTPLSYWHQNFWPQTTTTPRNHHSLLDSMQGLFAKHLSWILSTPHCLYPFLPLFSVIAGQAIGGETQEFYKLFPTSIFPASILLIARAAWCLSQGCGRLLDQCLFGSLTAIWKATLIKHPFLARRA